jgi:membrane protease YdiL (CAAX protease family)
MATRLPSFFEEFVHEVKAMAALQQTSFKAFIKRHPVLIFYVLTFAIAWGIVLLLIGRAGGIPGNSEQAARLFPFMIVALYAGPAVASLLVTGLTSGRAGFRELFSRLFKWRVAAGWYAVALLTAPAAWTVVLLALSPISSVFRSGLVTSSDKVSLLLFGIVGGLIVAVFEEVGWTWFATTRLRLRHGILATGLITGVLWGAFYLPVSTCGTVLRQPVPSPWPSS